MRSGRKPHGLCGEAPVSGGHMDRLRSVLSLALIAAFFVLLQPVAPAFAQVDPSLRISTQAPTSSFPKQPGGMFGPAPKLDKSRPLYLQADQLIYDSKGNRVIAQGNVEIYYNDFILTADQVIYDQGANKLLAEGNAQLKDPNGSITRADRMEALDDFRDAFIQSLSVVTRDDTRIAAKNAIRREGNVTEFQQGRFTPCKNDAGSPPLWCLAAARIVHDQQAATITYQDAQFEIFGVPIFYLPYFQHADPSVKRKSGFLTPTMGNSSTLGFSVEVPYYFALAPNYDFLFNPRYFSDRGTLWQGEFRHRLATGQYSVDFAAIDQSEPLALGDKGWRGSLHTKGQFSLSSWWRYGWDITLESDEAFRRDYRLDPVIQTDRVNVAYLQGMSERNYFGANLYHFGGLLLDDTSISNSRVHPVIDYNYIYGNPVAGGELNFKAHTRAMTRTDGTDTTLAVAEMNWRRKMIDPMGQVWTPFGNLRGDIYSWSNATDPGIAPEDTVVRGMATGGVLYSYPFVAHSGWATHVFEPTAQVIVRPNSIAQRRTPDEDARSLVFDDTLLFDVDRFSGYDRMETGTRVNVGMQYTLQANGGLYAKAILGQSIHVAGANPYADPGLDPVGVPNFSPMSGLQNDRSDYIAGLYLSPFTGMNLVSQARFDEQDWSLVRQDSLLQANYGPFMTQLGYTFTKFDPITGALDTQQEAIGTLGIRLTDRWSVLGQVRYDIDSHERIQDIFQLKYADECFVLTASYIETFVDNPALGIRPDQTLMLRFELKHLGDYTYRTDQLSHVFGDQRNGAVP
jgi:LPS-assembly protein